MNKAILTSFTILCLLSILFLTDCKISVKGDTDLIYVTTADHPTIQEAINNATSGDTIFVKAGIYYEHVVINKSVSLVGEARDSTIVDGNETGSVITIAANNVNISGFTIRNSGPYYSDSGIYVEQISGNGVTHNIITKNSHGISLFCSDNNVVSGNTISSNNYNGISLFQSRNNVVSGNTISSNNYEGISLYLSGNNVVSGNTISSNNYDGISLNSSSNNTIYCNNFNNTYQVRTDSTNVWDDGDEGNYWSNYNGTDADQDGIGDTHHKIDENNRDNHPLMGMFFDFNVTLEGKTYNITTICNSTISEFKFRIGTETGNKIISFNVAGKDGTVGFCRVMIPTELMNYPYIVLVGVEEIFPTLLNVSNGKYVCLYFTYIHSSHTITIISSKTLTELYNLNVTYYALLNNYGILLGNYSQLQEIYQELNSSHYALLNNYGILLGNYIQLQEIYHGLLDNYSILLGSYSQLQKSHQELNSSYQEHLLDYSKKVHNIRNLAYIFAATTAIFIITTIYLSKRAHAGKTKMLLHAQHKKLLDKSTVEKKFK